MRKSILARSPAPDATSHDASVLVLTRRGYETAVEGKKGWVGRGWMAMCDHREFWSTGQGFGTQGCTIRQNAQVRT